MAADIPSSKQLDGPRFTASGVWRGIVEIAPIAAFVIPFGIAFGLFGSGLTMWIIWIVSTAVGALAGSLLGDLSRFGFDAVMVAYFTAVIVGWWKGQSDLFPFVTAAAVAVTGTYVLPPGWHIIAGALAGGIVGMWRHD